MEPKVRRGIGLVAHDAMKKDKGFAARSPNGLVG